MLPTLVPLDELLDMEKYKTKILRIFKPFGVDVRNIEVYHITGHLYIIHLQSSFNSYFLFDSMKVLILRELPQLNDEQGQVNTFRKEIQDLVRFNNYVVVVQTLKICVFKVNNNTLDYVGKINRLYSQQHQYQTILYLPTKNFIGIKQTDASIQMYELKNDQLAKKMKIECKPTQNELCWQIFNIQEIKQSRNNLYVVQAQKHFDDPLRSYLAKIKFGGDGYNIKIIKCIREHSIPQNDLLKIYKSNSMTIINKEEVISCIDHAKYLHKKNIWKRLFKENKKNPNDDYPVTTKYTLTSTFSYQQSPYILVNKNECEILNINLHNLEKTSPSINTLQQIQNSHFKIKSMAFNKMNIHNYSEFKLNLDEINNQLALRRNTQQKKKSIIRKIKDLFVVESTNREILSDNLPLASDQVGQIICSSGNQLFLLNFIF